MNIPTVVLDNGKTLRAVLATECLSDYMAKTGATMQEAVEVVRLLPLHRPDEPSAVDHPTHYNAGGIECIDAIRAALTPDEFRGFCKGNAFKYAWRERHKGGDQDLAKANWYLTEIKK